MFSHYRLILQTDLDAMHHYVMLWIAQANEKLHTQHLVIMSLQSSLVVMPLLIPIFMCKKLVMTGSFKEAL